MFLVRQRKASGATLVAALFRRERQIRRGSIVTTSRNHYETTRFRLQPIIPCRMLASAVVFSFISSKWVSSLLPKLDHRVVILSASRSHSGLSECKISFSFDFTPGVIIAYTNFSPVGLANYTRKPLTPCLQSQRRRCPRNHSRL